jgi:hypothetical protein
MVVLAIGAEVHCGGVEIVNCCYSESCAGCVQAFGFGLGLRSTRDVKLRCGRTTFRQATSPIAVGCLQRR